VTLIPKIFFWNKQKKNTKGEPANRGLPENSCKTGVGGGCDDVNIYAVAQCLSVHLSQVCVLSE